MRVSANTTRAVTTTEGPEGVSSSADPTNPPATAASTSRGANPPVRVTSRRTDNGKVGLIGRRCGTYPTSSDGARSTLPSLTSISPRIAFTHVDLPAPLAPKKKTRLPRAISRSTCRTIHRSPRRTPTSRVRTSEGDSWLRITHGHRSVEGSSASPTMLPQGPQDAAARRPPAMKRRGIQSSHVHATFDVIFPAGVLAGCVQKTR